jgi:hypothetical protein
LLANPSLQLRVYEIGLDEDPGLIGVMESRLRELKEAESLSNTSEMEMLQRQAILLNESREKYITDIYHLKSRVALLGKVAELIMDTTLPMDRYFHKVGERDEQLHLLSLRNCVEKVGAASQMMFDMTLLEARVSSQK